MNIVLDIETIDPNYQLISDIAWANINRNKIVEVKNFIPMENLARMADGFFSKPKMAATMAEVTNGNCFILPWSEIAKELRKDCEEASRIYAYNAQFDRNGVVRTSKGLFDADNVEYFTSGDFTDKWRDLWAWASHTILYKKSFIDFCDALELRTPKGYCSTSAETTMKFITNNPDYEEAHTARADVLDEFQIYLAIKKAIKREYDEICKEEDEVSFKGKPFVTLKNLETAMVS